ncbi:MAG: glycosyltransferase family 2 protein [Cytophagales bacterium]
MTEVAIVILNYNGRRFLDQFLPSVIAHSGSASIVVADNGSTDGSVTFLKERFPFVQIIASEMNRGFCGGYNFALRQVQATYYVLLNSDVEVTPGWLHPIIELFKTNPRLGAAQPKILSYRNKRYFEYAGAGGGLIDGLGYPFCRGRIFNSLEEDQGQYDDTRPIFWATGACHFVRADLYHQLGGLDEDYFAHMEEIDFCWRLQRAGYEVYYQGTSTVYHVGGGTLSSLSPKKTYYNFRNCLSMITKHMPWTELVWKLPVRLMLDWVAALKFLVQPSPADAWAVVKAHFYFFTHVRAEWRKRSVLNQTLQGFDTTFQRYPHFIVIDYFLLRNTFYTNLRNPR